MVDLSYRHPAGQVERVRVYSPVNTKKGAVSYEAQVRRALLEGTWKQSPEAETLKPCPTFQAFADEFLQYYETQASPGTVANYRATIEHHFVPAFGKLPVRQIDARTIDKYKAEATTKLAPGSVNNTLAQLSRVLGTARRWGYCEEVPEIEKVKTQADKYDFLDFHEADLLLGALKGTRWHPVVLTAIRTGMRVGELAALCWRDVHLERNRVTVRQSYRSTTGWGPTKARRSREVPITWDVVEALRELRKSATGETVFGQEGKPMSHRSLAGALNRATKTLRMRHVHPHMLRHTAASHAVMRGVHPAVVMEWLGHSSLSYTMRYAHLAPRVHDEAVQLMAPPRLQANQDVEPG